MKENTLVPRSQSIGEEIGNSISHGLGTFFSVAGMIILIILGIRLNSLMAVLSAVFYGASLIILYSASTLYHSISNNTAKKVFQKLDHCSIFILISGTYIPISLLIISGKIGSILLITNVCCGIFGIVLNAINVKRFKKVSMLLYIIMGWMCVFTFKPLVLGVSAEYLWLILGGGIAYTVGIIFYKLKNKYMHFIWHIFVLLGSFLHYLFILFSCYL